MIHVSEITGLCFLDFNQKTFLNLGKVLRDCKVCIDIFSLLRFRQKVYSLMIFKYLIHFVSVRDNQNVNEVSHYSDNLQ